MAHAQMTTQAQHNKTSFKTKLHLIECAMVEDVESFATDEVDNYIFIIRRHEQHEHYLQNEIEEDTL